MLHRLVSALISWVIGLFASGGASVAVAPDARTGAIHGEVVLRSIPDFERAARWTAPIRSAWTPTHPETPPGASHLVVLRRLEARHASPEPIEAQIGTGPREAPAE